MIFISSDTCVSLIPNTNPGKSHVQVKNLLKFKVKIQNALKIHRKAKFWKEIQSSKVPGTYISRQERRKAHQNGGDKQ